MNAAYDREAFTDAEWQMVLADTRKRGVPDEYAERCRVLHVNGPVIDGFFHAGAKPEHFTQYPKTLDQASRIGCMHSGMTPSIYRKWRKHLTEAAAATRRPIPQQTWLGNLWVLYSTGATLAQATEYLLAGVTHCNSAADGFEAGLTPQQTVKYEKYGTRWLSLAGKVLKHRDEAWLDRLLPRLHHVDVLPIWAALRLDADRVLLLNAARISPIEVEAHPDWQTCPLEQITVLAALTGNSQLRHLDLKDAA